MGCGVDYVDLEGARAGDPEQTTCRARNSCPWRQGVLRRRSEAGGEAGDLPGQGRLLHETTSGQAQKGCDDAALLPGRHKPGSSRHDALSGFFKGPVSYWFLLPGANKNHSLPAQCRICVRGPEGLSLANKDELARLSAIQDRSASDLHSQHLLQER